MNMIMKFNVPSRTFILYIIIIMLISTPITIFLRWLDFSTRPKKICGFPISSCKNLGRVGRF
jgi:hypothetical protein